MLELGHVGGVVGPQDGDFAFWFWFWGGVVGGWVGGWVGSFLGERGIMHASTHPSARRRRTKLVGSTHTNPSPPTYLPSIRSMGLKAGRRVRRRPCPPPVAAANARVF